MRIAILCAAANSEYFKLQDKYDLDIYTEKRDCRNFQFDCPVTTHAPCAQWSRFKAFARSNEQEKNLAWFCLDATKRCTGIFEHPSGSSFFKDAQLDFSKIYSVNLSWFGYPAQKRTYLFYNSISLDSHSLSFDAIQKVISTSKKAKTLPEIKKDERHITPLAFNEWLIQSIINSQPAVNKSQTN